MRIILKFPTWASMPNEAEVAGVDYVIQWAKKRKIKVTPTHRDGVGYDLKFEYPDGSVEKIEVKGSRKPHAIPDMRVSEFEKFELKADYMYVVGNVLAKGNERLYRIPKSAIKAEHLSLRQTYHIRRFQGRKNMEKYLFKEEH